ncbi:restriction endonuclease [Acidithiobacillus sp. AC3]
MAKRRKNNELGIAAAIILLLFILGSSSGKTVISDFFSVFGAIAIFVAALLVVLFLWKHQRRKRIREQLLAAGTSNPRQLTPEQYEQFCAALLANNGWHVQTTAKTGDYGADVIATKGNQKIIVQCKQWTSSVGIKAVQEAHGALSYYKGTRAVVVTTSKYSQAAQELAKKTGVSLISHEDLIGF